MEQAYLALVLHAHLPFIRHPEREDYLEERWLFEALTETYMPLLHVFEGLARDHVKFHITMSFSPPLLEMLSDPLLQGRYGNHLARLIELAEQEVQRTKELVEFNQLAHEYLHRFRQIQATYIRCNRNILGAFRRLRDAGHIELITSAATHAFLPLIRTEEAVRAQLTTAIECFQRHFVDVPRGLWLPECGYAPVLDPILRELGLDFFFVDSHGIRTATPTPQFDTLVPVLTPHGVAAFARDEESSREVWSSKDGYPGDYDYREYYRDIGHDLDLNTIAPYIHPSGIRVNTGIKYYRITGQGAHKEPYDPVRAKAKVLQHAKDFLTKRSAMVCAKSQAMNRRPVIVAPYDAELFGHWWYEGPQFLDALFRHMHSSQDTVQPITPTEYLALYPDYQVCQLAMSSWGRDGYADVWLNEANDWIYPALHRAETQMVALAAVHHDAPAHSLTARSLNQAARELMLAQSSDWAFIMDNKTMMEYAIRRTKHHINRFSQLVQMVKSNSVHEEWLAELEQMDNLFPDIDFRVYTSHRQQPAHARHREDAQPPAHSRLPAVAQLPAHPRRPEDTRHPAVNSDAARRVLMLSWEFPPMTVGGLSRHVYHLSRYLQRLGMDVHVVTSQPGGCPSYERTEGVHVHRVDVAKPDGGEFVHWAFQMNLAMVDACRRLGDSGLSFELIHAHDWLVYYTASTLKQCWDVPLIATIHATEHGRNHGIATDTQRYIHNLECQLTALADEVIVCSTYMKREVMALFDVSDSRVHVIPNGVDATLLKVQADTGIQKADYGWEHNHVVVFLGRLVREKGVHILLDAALLVSSEYPNTKFVIVGRGPTEAELKHHARQLGLSEKVQFMGFVHDDERNRLLSVADVAVFPSLYEPFGIVALEAMAAGAPVVVSDVGGLADVVSHQRNGLKAYPGDAPSLAAQLKHLLKDRGFAESIARSASQGLERYDWMHIAQQTLQIYEKVPSTEELWVGALQTATH